MTNTTFKRLSARGKQLIIDSRRKAAKMRLTEVNAHVLLLSILDDEDSRAAQTLTSAYPGMATTLQALIDHDMPKWKSPHGAEDRDVDDISLSGLVNYWITKAAMEADKVGAIEVDPEHILLSLLRNYSALQHMLDEKAEADYIQMYLCLQRTVPALQPA